VGVARRAEGKRRPNAHPLVDEVMGFLISSDWVLGEAQDLNIYVSAAEVRRRFDHSRREQFPKRGEFKAFLRSSGQTVADLLFRVRLSILSTRIQRQVIASEFANKWRAQTYCSPPYAVRDCGHVQTVL
jgi:hypothetical protein